MGNEIIISIIGLVGVLATALLSYAANRRERSRRVHAEKELEIQSEALDFARFMEDWDDTYRDLSDIFADTNIDRFMIFRAWNGLYSPRWATSVFQVRKGIQKPISYVHIELDTDYVGRLREVEARRPVNFMVADLPPSMIKSVYENEGVTAAAWSHIETTPGAIRGSSSITYCSFATHEGSISPHTYTRCLIFANRLKAVAERFRKEQRNGS